MIKQLTITCAVNFFMTVCLFACLLAIFCKYYCLDLHKNRTWVQFLLIRCLGEICTLGVLSLINFDLAVLSFLALFQRLNCPIPLVMNFVHKYFFFNNIHFNYEDFLFIIFL